MTSTRKTAMSSQVLRIFALLWEYKSTIALYWLSFLRKYPLRSPTGELRGIKVWQPIALRALGPSPLPLLLLMLGICFAYNKNTTFASNYFALFANFFNWCSYFHYYTIYTYIQFFPDYLRGLSPRTLCRLEEFWWNSSSFFRINVPKLPVHRLILHEKQYLAMPL